MDSNGELRIGCNYGSSCIIKFCTLAIRNSAAQKIVSMWYEEKNMKSAMGSRNMI